MARARAAGVVQMVTIQSGSDEQSSLDVIAIAERYPFVYAAIGIHPHDSSVVDDQVVARIERLSAHEKVVAIGEAGLDYHYDNSPREAQRAAFERWLESARSLQLPVVVHTRDAEEDTLAILRAHDVQPSEAIIHCFTGSIGFARACLDLGLMISIPGVVTFKRPGDVPAVAAEVPIDQLLVETDSPFMAPAPLRGRQNEPANVVWTARKVAELRGMSYQELAPRLVENTRRIFRLPAVAAAEDGA